MWRASREAGLSCCLPFVTTFAPPRSPAPSRPNPRRVWPPSDLPATKTPWPASDPATTTPRGWAYRSCRPQIRDMQVRERGTWKENIQKYSYMKHPKHPWPILGKVCAWRGSCDSIYMHTHINPQHYIFVKTILDIPAAPLKVNSAPGKIHDNTRQAWS